MNNKIHAFIKESFGIEGVNYTNEDFHDFKSFLNLKRLTFDDIIKYNKHGDIRGRIGMNVKVGGHTPMPGGARVAYALQFIVDRIEITHPYEWHNKFEMIHPFTDGNGRTGRAIWAWQMMNIYDYDLSLGFLHKYYYQSLEFNEVK